VERARRRVGTVLREKWQITKLLGVGGMAAVYAATHRNGKRAALKILHPEYCAQPQFVTRFLREGYVANKIEHPASVAILDDEVCEDGSVFLVMELLEGTSLDRFTRRGDARRLPLARILGMADDVLDLLKLAHSKGIVHRDLKPANIFLTSSDQVKVLDFGIARLAERTLDGSATQTGAAMGTPAYMPPEQARGRWNQVDARTDLWALGATTFALVAGDRPRRAETVQEELLLAMTTPLPSLASTAPGCPPEVAAWVDRAVAYDMEARWPDAGTMQYALRAITRKVDVTTEQLVPTEFRAAPSAPNDAVIRTDAPSQPSAHPDTAPVLLNGGERVEASTHMTAGGTMGKSRSAPRRPLLGAAIASVVLGVLAGGVILIRSRAATPSPATETAAAARPPAPISVPIPPSPAPAPEPAAPPAAPATGTMATAGSPEAPTSAVPPPDRPKAAASPRSASNAPSTAASTKARPPPAATANPLDQRF
jgi:eukaryotic-like serine/threonine-protein kinase